MRPIYSIPFGADFIEEVSTFILKDEGPLDRKAVVFPGKRPALYLRRRLAEKVGGPFYSPGFFSVETFVDYTVKKAFPSYTDLEYNDAVWLLYQAAESIESLSGHLFRERGFDRFYYWGRHLFSFIDQIDTENVPEERLLSLEKNAELGYDVPGSVNTLLGSISLLRKRFHAMLDEEGLFTRGYKYLSAIRDLDRFSFDEFDRIYFAGLFGMTGAEKEITKHLRGMGKADIIFEGSPGEWPILGQMAAYFDAEVETIPCRTTTPESIRFYSGFDAHAEALKVSKILKETAAEKTAKTAVVLPLSEALFPLLSFAVEGIDTPYNISLGYPLSRTPVFDLLSNVIAAQITRRADNTYSTRAYLEVVLHPFVKNLTLHDELRTLLGTLERLLTGEEQGSIVADRAFIALEEMERAARLAQAPAMIALQEIHRLFFRSLEHASTLYEYAEKLEQLLDFILHNTPVRSYVLSGEIFARTFELLEKTKETRFGKEVFHKGEKENRLVLCDFLLQFLKSAGLPFETRPVEPLEIIGVLESRNLRFDTVIMLDVNEGVIPQPRKIDPLVPLGIYDKLEIPSPEYNEEIYRYYFYRLIKSAKNVHLIHIDTEDRPRSRYMEQIIWEMEREKKALDVITVDRTTFPIRLAAREILPEIGKSEEVLTLLSKRTYSPSEIDEYVRCPVSFYHSRVLRFEEKREVTEEIDDLDRGKVIHAILHETFEPYRGKEITSAMYEPILHTMEEALEREFRHRVITGEYYLFKKLASFKLESFLRKNVKEAPNPFVITHLEQPFESTLPVGGASVGIKGRIDRIQFSLEEGEHMIIDYKTGGTKQYPGSVVGKVDFTSTRDLHKRVPTFQLPLYVHLVRRTLDPSPGRINGKLLFLKDNGEEVLFKDKGTGEREAVQEKYMEGVKTILSEILDPSTPFRPFDDLSCAACPYNLLCHV